MNYNILNGFCNGNPPYILDKKRMESAIKLIKSESPDILILTEAYFWPFAKKENLSNVKKIFEDLYGQYTSLAHDYFRWAPIVLSKFKIKDFNFSLSDFNLKFLRVNLDVNRKPITMDVFHPHPDTTEKEKSNFLKRVLKKDKKNQVLAGDFNALFMEDTYDKQKFSRGYESFMGSRGKSKAKDMLKCLTIKTILKKKLIDTYKVKNKKFDYTIPTNLMSKNKDGSARIDYIFCSKDFKVIDSGIIKNELTEEASDHYPVYAVLEI